MYGACKARASSAAQPCECAKLQRFTWVCCSWHVRFCMLKQTLVVCQRCIMSAGCTVLPSPTLAESCVNSELTAFLRSNMQWDTASCRDTTGTTLIDDACSAECLPGFVDNGLKQWLRVLIWALDRRPGVQGRTQRPAQVTTYCSSCCMFRRMLKFWEYALLSTAVLNTVQCNLDSINPRPARCTRDSTQ
jgi:hypothetical protein